MDSTSPRQMDASGVSPHTTRATQRRRTTSTPFRELRRHLAVTQRTLDRGQTGRASNNLSLAVGLSESVCLIARTARRVGLTSYCSLALHVLEQLASAKRTSYVPSDTRDLLREWLRLSWSYLFAPATAAHAVELIGHMGDRRWDRPVCRIQRDSLLESLQQETLHLAMIRSGICSSARR